MRPSGLPSKPLATRYADLPRTGRAALIRISLHRAQMLDELGDGLADGALCAHVAALVDPELVAPHRHRSRAVRAHVDAAPVDDVANQHRRKLAVPLCDRRQIRHDYVQRRRHGTVAARSAAVATRTEALEKLGAR